MPRPQLGKHSRRTKLSSRYRSMIQRCTNPACKSYPRYGGRGVTVCSEWLESYDAFADWALANGYEDGLELDKDILSAKLGINPPIYSPHTCMFITTRDNVLNSTSTKFTDEQVLEIVTEFDSAPDTFEHRAYIKNKYGLVNKQLGCLLARRAGKKLGRGKSGVLLPNVKQEIIRLHDEGFKFPIIAEKLGINYNTCKAWHAKYRRGEDPECPRLNK